MLLLLVITHPLAWLLGYIHPRIWVKIDVRRFDKDGAKDSLLRAFHKQRGLIRTAAMVLLAALVSLPAWGYWLPLALSFTGLLVAQAAYWSYDFNPRLSVARNQSYVGRYHVSWNPDAAYFPDRYVWRRAWRQVRRPGETNPPGYEDSRVVAVAGPLLKQLLENLLINGLAIYLLTLLSIGICRWLAN